MLSSKQKIEHLRKLGFKEDLTEIEKMYKGEPFDTKDIAYKKLLILSRFYCLRFTELSQLIATSEDESEIKYYKKEKHKILNILFPGHGIIFGAGDGLFAIIGMVDFDGFNYINARVHFNASSCVHLGKYVSVASNVEFGDNTITLNKNTQTGKIDIQRDTWIGANVHLEDNTSVGARSLIAMGSVVVSGSKLNSDNISYGNPCIEHKVILNDYKTKIKQPPKKARRTDDEIKIIITHIRKLGIKGNLEQYIRAINNKKYNTIDPTIAKIYDLSHKLCAEYNNPKTKAQRRKEILNSLFPLQGENLIVGEDIFVDCIGTVKIGNNVTIGNGSTLAGNITIGDYVRIGDNVTLQTTGHEINSKGRRIYFRGGFPQPCVVSTPGFIIVEKGIVLANQTKVIPDRIVTTSTEKDELVIR